MTKPQDILQECLERLEQGESLETVLARYPTQRDELAPLLALTMQIRQSAPSFSESAKSRVRYQVYGAARARPAPRARPAWHTWLARVAISALVVVLLGASAWVATAESAPGKPLFPARALLNEARAQRIADPRAALELHLQNAEERLEDVRIRYQHHLLNEAAIFWMVGETENLMVTVENHPYALERATLERIRRLILAERALLRELIQNAPVERARRNAETLYQLSATWESVLNRGLGK